MSWNTKVQLFTTVPFPLDYSHTRWFTSRTEQENYFNTIGGVTTYTNGNYVKIDEGKVKIQRLKDRSDVFNYMIIHNQSGTSNRKYYCFVKEVNHIANNVSEIEFEIDVLQTFMFDAKFNQSFIERQHDKPNNIYENLDLGDEYITVLKKRFYRDIDTLYSTLVVSTTTEMLPDSKSTGTITAGVLSPIIHHLFLVPKFSTPHRPEIKVNGTTLYGGAISVTQIANLIFDTFFDDTLANRIVGINYLPFFPLNASLGANSYTINIPEPYGYKVVSWGSTDTKVLAMSTAAANNFLAQSVQFDLGSVSSLLANVPTSDPKLKRYPYTKINMYDGLGGMFEIKPELLTSNNLIIRAKTSVSSVPRVSYEVRHYAGNDGGINNAIISSPNADIEVINDHTATYFQGRKNSDLASMNRTGWGGALQTAGGLAIAGASLATGNPLGVISGATMFAGGYVNAFGGQSEMLAKHQDIERIPPSLANQAGTSNLHIGYGEFMPFIEVKSIRPEYINQIESYFKQYGYAIKQLKTMNLRTKTHYNFVKTIGANITGPIPQVYLDTIRRIFDTGITLWHTNDMYNYNVNNKDR